MQMHRIALAVAAAFPLVALAQVQSPESIQFAATRQDSQTKNLGVVTVVGNGQPTSLPTQIPTTIEGISKEQIAQSINATDSEDAIRYFPSLLVRKRYIGDYNHAVLSSRASGTGNSARSAVYADGILLSNYLGNGATFAPRWGLVTPEEIERADVMYGPFSAAYPGNSVGAVVDYVTRMPQKLEAHVKAGYVSQPFSLYNTNDTFKAWQTSASLGSREGDWSWFVNLSHTNSHGQPLTFPTRLVSAGVKSSAGTPVSGAVLDANNALAPWYNLGTGTEYTTIQDHAKIKVAYDVTPTVRASYTYGLWKNNSEGRPTTYLRDAKGQPVYSGAINIDGRAFTGANALGGGDFPLTNEDISHTMHGVSVKSHTQGVFDWEVAASQYNYGTDTNRRNASANFLPAAQLGGAGTVADAGGTGWNALALKGIWRPDGVQGAHAADFGLQQDRYTYRTVTSNIAGNWITDAAGSLGNDVGGNSGTLAMYAQDSWAFAPLWKTVLGARVENWTTGDGYTTFGLGNSANTRYASRDENFVSPKAALSYQWSDSTVLKGAVGRAVRFPTVTELYGSTSTTNSQYVNDPNLKPEKSVTTEVSAEKDFGSSSLRMTVFAEDTQDALYSQTTFDAVANKNISRVQNVNRIQTQGVELSFNGENVTTKGLDISASITYTDSTIRENSGFVAVAGDTIGSAAGVARYQSQRRTRTLNPFSIFYQGSTMKLTTLATVLALSSGALFAQAVEVKDTWARATVPGQKATGAFMKLTAKDGAKLVGASSPVAGVVEVHEMKMDGDIMKMRAVAGGLDLPAGKIVELKPGGYHVMLMDLKVALQKDTTIPLTLVFNDAKGVETKSAITVPVNTEAPAGGMPMGEQKH